MPEHPSSSRTTLAVVDIGTNTILLLVAEIGDAGQIHPLAYEQRIPRLGQGVDSRRRLSADAMQRAVTVLNEYRSIIARHSPSTAVVIGTSAVRDASNKDEFVSLVRARTGFTVEVLSGADEALWTYRGAISGITGVDRATVVDIGGGSTEISTGSASSVDSSISIDIGSVRLTERFIKHDPPQPEEVRAIKEAIETALRIAKPPAAPFTLVAVAGTATTLALLARDAREFSLEAVSGVILTLAEIESLASTLSQKSVAQILAAGSYLTGRADVITAGAMILVEVMKKLGAGSVVVSERGVRYGIALREWERGRTGEGGRGEGETLRL